MNILHLFYGSDDCVVTSDFLLMEHLGLRNS